MKSKVVSEVILILLFVSFLATYRAETEDVDTRVYVDPPISSAAPGYTFSIDVVLTNVTELSGWSFKLFWENSILECITEVIHYPLNCNWEDPNNIKVGPGIQQDYNETHGRWFRGLAALSMSEPYPEAFTGTIILASLNFTVIGLGVTTLHLQETKLSDPDAYPISHTAEDGGFEYEPPEHDVAVLLEAPCHVVPGDSVPLNATVLNGGLNDEVEVELNLLINGDPKDSMVISFLHAGSSHTLSYLWTPTVEAVYNVTAYALPVPKEEDIANNVKSQMVLVSDVIEVPLHYPTIQEAIDAASPKDTILVSAGTYYEELIIDKSMTVTGEENSSTIVDGSGGSWVFKIEADDVEISKFTIQNGHLGIYSTDNNYAVINGNTITNNLGVGIYLDSSNHNTVSGNTLSNNRDGILLEYSSHCVLRDNSMTMNRRNFGVLGKYMSNFVHDIDTSNTVDGKPVYYWVDQRDRIVPADAGYVGAIHSISQ